MGNMTSSSASVAMIAALITPALLILASASVVATVLVRMARVVDRARVVAAAVHELAAVGHDICAAAHDVATSRHTGTLCGTFHRGPLRHSCSLCCDLHLDRGRSGDWGIARLVAGHA